MIGEVVQQLHVVQSHVHLAAEDGSDGAHTRPIDVPVATRLLLLTHPAPPLEVRHYHILLHIRLPLESH